MKHSIISAFSETILYVPGLRELTGSISSAILMMQLEYWFRRYPDGFYKFLEAPQKNHPDYTLGDSWTEELAFGKEEFRSAFDRIGVRFNSRSQFEEAQQTEQQFGSDKYYCSYYDRQSGLTFYLRSHERMEKFIAQIQPRVKGSGKKPRKSTPKNDHVVDHDMVADGFSDFLEIGSDDMGKSDLTTSSCGRSRFPDPYIYSETTKTEITPDMCVITRTREETHTPELNKKPEPEASQVLTSTQIVNIQPVQTIQSSGKDQSSAGQLAKTKYDPGLGMRPPAPKVKFLIPEGDWLTETGQLDPAFIRHVAKQWMDSPKASFHKMPIEEVEGKVFSHFARKENHTNLVVAWQAYSDVSLRHAEGVKQRLDAGIFIPESEQRQIFNEGRAIASALSQPEEEKAVPSLPTQEDRKPFGFVLPEATPQAEPPKLIEAPRDDDGSVENPSAYQPYRPEPISPEEQKANIDKMNEMIRATLKVVSPYAKQKNKRAIASFPSNLSEANDWLSDPCLRSQALLWAKRECYVINYTPEGTAFEIEDPEF